MVFSTEHQIILVYKFQNVFNDFNDFIVLSKPNLTKYSLLQNKMQVIFLLNAIIIKVQSFGTCKVLLWL